MKTVFNNSELPHRWAHAGPDDHGHSPNWSCSFQGRILRSYQTDIGRIIEPGRVVVLNATSYSNTTNKHQSAMLKAVSHFPYIFHVDGLGRGERLRQMTPAEISWRLRAMLRLRRCAVSKSLAQCLDAAEEALRNGNTADALEWIEAAREKAAARTIERLKDELHACRGTQHGTACNALRIAGALPLELTQRNRANILCRPHTDVFEAVSEAAVMLTRIESAPGFAWGEKPGQADWETVCARIAHHIAKHETTGQSVPHKPSLSLAKLRQMLRQ